MSTFKHLNKAAFITTYFGCLAIVILFGHVGFSRAMFCWYMQCRSPLLALPVGQWCHLAANGRLASVWLSLATR